MSIEAGCPWGLDIGCPAVDLGLELVRRWWHGLTGCCVASGEGGIDAGIGMGKSVVSRVLVDNGATINVFPPSRFKRLGYKPCDLVKTSVAVSGFNGRKSECLGVFSMHLEVGRQERETAFFVIDIIPTFNALLGRDWLHKAAAIPSTLHRELLLWVNSEIETIKADEYFCWDKGILHAETSKTVKDLTLDQRYKLGDPTVGPLVEPSGKFDYIVNNGTSHPKPDTGLIVPTGWGDELSAQDIEEVLQGVNSGRIWWRLTSQKKK
ncbi:hypothetical protein MLD38_028667 [Melastoma candidum]|uniref:Uncharacterized protein n=1 Tax=Melastoma candidum TaxID=119954 RepID=A0ACB9N1D3_9MYRT|nr:hypothetical protein MLD38_028667 [Melastoma candidum]